MTRTGGDAGKNIVTFPTPDQTMALQRILRESRDLRDAAMEYDLHFLAYLLDMAVCEADRLSRASETDDEA